ncbi:putative structural protein [Rhizobium phage RHph_X2_24]|nr:putative structural protein [Rhizobium phage RHph_X2_24]
MRKHLLASAAYNNTPNAGAVAMAAYKRSPDPEPLVSAAHAAVARTDGTYDGEKLLARASDIACMVPYWDMTDAIVEGYDAVKNAGETYLPKFAEELTQDYKVRQQLTKFTNVYRDIVEGLASKPFEEEITIVGESKSIPAEITAFIEDVDGAGNNLTVFSSLTFFNGINSAIDWIFVDYPTVDRERVRTMADQKAAGIRPFWTHVLGRNVFEVRTKIINGKQVINYIRIYEPGVSEPDRVRIFVRDDSGIVTWALFEKMDKNGADGKPQFAIVGEGTLSISVIPMVPFVTGRRDGSSWKFFPAMRDAADLQIKLYQAESGLEFVTTMAGYPMLAANGMRPEMEADGKTPKKIAIGPGRVLWGIPDGNGNAGSWSFVEPNASSMKFLQEKIDKTKQDLRELGRQPLTAQSGNLTVITTAVAAGKARSAVSAWALNLKDALENALQITAMFIGGSLATYEPEVNVFNEFDDITDGGSDLTALNTARKNRDISRKTLLVEYKRRKVLSPEFDDEDDLQELLNEVPADTEEPEQSPGNAA